MKLLIFGSRNWTDAEAIKVNLLFYLNVIGAGVTVIHGAAPGADTLAGLIAKSLGFTVRDYPVDTRIDGQWPAAGPRRNSRILTTEHTPDDPITFAIGYRSRGKSNGTDDMARKCKRMGIEVTIRVA